MIKLPQGFYLSKIKGKDTRSENAGKEISARQRLSRFVTHVVKKLIV